MSVRDINEKALDEWWDKSVVDNDKNCYDFLWKDLGSYKFYLKTTEKLIKIKGPYQIILKIDFVFSIPLFVALL